MSAPLIQIKVDPETLAKATRDLAEIQNGLPKAYARALNKTTTGVKTDLVRLISEDYNYYVAKVRERIILHKATWSFLTSIVVSSGRQPHLTDVKETVEKKPQGVFVNVQKSTGRQRIPRAFIAPGRTSGKLIVWHRASAGDGRLVGRMPIEARRPPHPENIYNTPANWAIIQKQAQARLDENFAHEVDVVLRGIA